jgi:hypothetical protein
MEEENERKAELEVRGTTNAKQFGSERRGEAATSIAFEHKKYLVSICDEVPKMNDYVRSFVRDDIGWTAGPHFEGGQHTKPR